VRTTITVAYALMAAWLLISSIARIAIQVTGGQRLDALPFVGCSLALLAIGLLVVLGAQHRRRTAGRR